MTLYDRKCKIRGLVCISIEISWGVWLHIKLTKASCINRIYLFEAVCNCMYPQNDFENIFENFCAMCQPSNSTYNKTLHCNNVIMGAIASQVTSITIVYSTVYSGADPRKHQSSASLAFVRGIHRWPVNSPHRWPVTRKMSPFDDSIALAIELRLFCI